MSYTLKGFANIGALIDNTNQVVAPLGELAPIGWTYAREKTHHQAADYPGITFSSFTSTQGGAHVQPDETFINGVLAVINWIYTQANAGSFSQDAAAFQSLFINRWGDTTEFHNSGVMIKDGSIWAPEFFDISFTNATIGDNRVKVWLASDSFLNQFDDFEILVVPPLVPIDQFFGDYNAVKALVAAITWPDLVSRLEETKAGYPETLIRSDSFDWVDANDRTKTISTDWTTVIYGAAGNNIDNIKTAIVDYILNNSTHTRDEWAVIFPDIFQSTEFIITPMWNNYAIPNQVLVTGLYSSTVNFVDAEAIAVVTAKGTGYTEEFVKSVLSAVASTYKSLQLLAVGGPNNRDGVNKFYDEWPDYMAIPTTNTDFGRMSKDTRAFIAQLTEQLMYAETMTPDTSVPLNYSRMQRDGVYYIVRSYGKVQYLVVLKYSLNDSTLFPNLLTSSDGSTLSNDTGDSLVNN